MSSISLYKDGVKISVMHLISCGLFIKFGASDDYFMLLNKKRHIMPIQLQERHQMSKDTSPKVLVLLKKMDRKGQFPHL
jgi:hypothetical protein